MKKPVILFITICVGVLTALAPAYCQEDMQVVDNGVFDNPQRPSAVFYHDTHNETAGLDDCGQCHHLHDESGNKLEGESSEDQMCSDCHGDQDEGRKPNLTKAYHLNCKGCHLETKAGPVVCAQCHAR